ncbi:MAG: hypothetical protein ACQESG_06960 [Nanobdellota archaeon]
MWPLDFLCSVDGEYHQTAFAKSDHDSIQYELADFWSGVIPYYESRPLGYVFTAVYALIENATYYSGVPEPITLEVLLEPDFMVTGVHDGGDYFRRPDVKAYWENRRVHPETFFDGVTVCEDGHTTGRHRGVRDVIYPLSDFIHVDTDCGKVLVGFHTK